MRWFSLTTLHLIAIGASAAAAPSTPTWREVARGVEYVALRPGGAATDAEAVHVVRIDPDKARLRAVMASDMDRKPRTAGSWCDREHLVAAINLGMFLDDGRSNVGYARSGAHVNHARWVKKYKSVLVFGPRKAGIPAAAILDLDAPGVQERLADYETVIQNLRLIKAPGSNGWGANAQRWSEAAIAIDRSGRLLLVFCRAPHSMFEFNRLLLSLPLDVTAAMHVEGGPEASLSVRGKGLMLDLNGSYETGFNENDELPSQWPIPNVLGVLGNP
jgi:hypothetical protein